MTTFLETLRSGTVKQYVKNPIGMKQTFGDSSNDIIDTDATVQYLIELIKEKRDDNPDKQFAMTQSLTTQGFVRFVDDDDKKNIKLESDNILSVETVSTKLVNTYLETLGVISSGGVYTVLNATDDGSISHQNWLFLSIDDKLLIRFEPSREFSQFRTKELCNLVVKKLSEQTGDSYKWVIANGHGINTFSGCRAMSTLLATMYIAGIDVSTLEQFKTKGKIDEKYTLPFVYLMQEEIKKKIKCNPTVMIKTKRTRGNPDGSIGWVVL